MDEILKAKLAKNLEQIFTEDKKRAKSILNRLDEYVLMEISSFRNELKELMEDVIDYETEE